MATNPFIKPTTPKNSFELFKWLIYEPVLLERYEKTITSKIETIWIIFKFVIINFFVVVIPLTLLLYAIGIVIIAAFDLPLLFPPDYFKYKDTNAIFIQQWPIHSILWEKIFFFISFNNYQSLNGLIGGLTGGSVGNLIAILIIEMLTHNLVRSLVTGLLGGLVVGLLGGLLGGLEFGLVVSLVGGLVGGLLVGSEFGSEVGSEVGSKIGLVTSLLGGLAITLLVKGLAVGLVFVTCFYITYFRLYQYLWHFLKSLILVDLKRNPYINDGAIWLPIWGLTDKLTNEAQQDPKTGVEFGNFLLEYRPLQTKLAMHISHAATAGNWEHHILDSKYLTAPPIVQKNPSLTPSKEWLEQIQNLQQDLIAYEKLQNDQENISLKTQKFTQFNHQLQTFKDSTLKESYHWKQYYLPTIEKWLKVAEERSDKLRAEQQLAEPIAPNIYRYGDILEPDKDQNIFLGRQDLKSELRHIILTARSMPMLLIYGQRRIGKSSLLRFLPELLGSNFKIIRQDFQEAKLNSISLWLSDLQQQLDYNFDRESKNWQVPEDWLAAWAKIETELKNLSQQQEKIILAFDEYESLHKILQTNPQQGQRLLEAMRSFSQHQNQVVFLFVGATQFVDLQEPNWDRSFIHVMPLNIDYLLPEEAEKLIKLATLDYPTEVIDKIQTISQGHPALLQMLCYHIVKHANQKGSKDVSLEDVNLIVKDKIVQRGTTALSTFWTEFCQNYACKPAIHELLNNQPITDRKSQLKLEDYGYIIETETGWKLRVQLLEMWLKRYHEGI